MLWKIPSFLVIFNLQIIDSFLLAKSDLDLILMLIFFFHASPHSASVLALPFNHFLCDCLASCFLYFVRLKCNVLTVYIGRSMQLVSSEGSFHFKWARQGSVVEGKADSRKWRQRGRKTLFIFLKWLMFLLAQVIPEDNISVQISTNSCAICRARYLF